MNLIPYDFNSKRLQVLVDENGEPWFIAMEVAEILGYSDAYEMTKRLDEDEKSNRQIAGLGTASGGRGVTTINESGLYSSIIGSNKPEAKPFKRWVTHDVLPSIRRTGSYSIGHQQAPALTTDACQIIESMSRTLNLAPSATLTQRRALQVECCPVRKHHVAWPGLAWRGRERLDWARLGVAWRGVAGAGNPAYSRFD
ncbi:Bro-N domain-containing protein [Pseudomonas aeruginosa]|uniref:BRO-N domain-containing protein n=1 Tax=Pseudomonas aeruginosa TaxID=287 RepID=UPI0039BCBA17